MRNLENMTKYRVYMPDLKCWIIGNLFVDDGICYIYTNSSERWYISHDNTITIGKMIGKKDICDKDIFEGDILICVDKNTFISKMGVVVWNDETMSFDINDNQGNKICNAWTQCDLKIVGDKYFDSGILKHNFK